MNRRTAAEKFGVLKGKHANHTGPAGHQEKELNRIRKQMAKERDKSARADEVRAERAKEQARLDAKAKDLAAKAQARFDAAQKRNREEERERTLKAKADEVRAQAEQDRFQPVAKSDALITDKVRTGVITITPALATIWLEGKALNRPLSDATVRGYAQAMKDGTWDVNGETIKFAPDGTLIDGQHRLWGCMTANVPFRSAVAYDVDPATVLTVDSGRARTFASVMVMQGHGDKRHAIAIAGAARLWLSWEQGKCERFVNDHARTGHPKLMDTLTRHDKALTWAAAVLNSAPWTRIRGANAGNVFALSVLYEKDAEKAEQLVQAAVGGTSVLFKALAHLHDNQVLGHRGLEHRMKLIRAWFEAWNAFTKQVVVVKGDSTRGKDLRAEAVAEARKAVPGPV